MTCASGSASAMNETMNSAHSGRPEGRTRRFSTRKEEHSRRRPCARSPRGRPGRSSGMESSGSGARRSGPRASAEQLAAGGVGARDDPLAGHQQHADGRLLEDRVGSATRRPGGRSRMTATAGVTGMARGLPRQARRVIGRADVAAARGVRRGGSPGQAGRVGASAAGSTGGGVEAGGVALAGGVARRWPGRSRARSPAGRPPGGVVVPREPTMSSAWALASENDVPSSRIERKPP